MILIEGLPGTGKSTFAKNLVRALEGKCKVRLFLETDEDNPFIYKTGTTIDSNIEDFSNFVLNAWCTFLKNESYKDHIYIQESLTIQQQMNFPLVINKVEKGKSLINEIFKKIERVNPVLIYLYSSNPVAHFEKTMKSRGTEWEQQVRGTLSTSALLKDKKIDEPIKFFIEELVLNTEDVLEECPFRVLRFNIDEKSYDEILGEVVDLIYDENKKAFN